VLPATAAVALGLGALFSLGIVFVQDVLGASPAEFGILIALFGVGAVGGLGVLHRRRDRDALLETRRGVMAIGAVIAAFSLAGDVLLAFVGALAFGGAAAFTLASGMGVLQRRLDGDLRVVAFAVFHVVIRCALGVAAVVAGLAGDLLGGVPGLDEWEPARLVLLGAGGLIMGSALGVRVRVAATADPDPDPGSAP
jgi:dTMP kinase